MDVLLNILFWIVEFDYIWFFQTTFSALSPNTIVSILVWYFFLVWIALIIWVTKDITNRSSSLFVQIFSILLILLWTPFSIIIYLLIRPSKTLFEKYYDSTYEEEYYDDVEENITKCSHCGFKIWADYKYCPNCKTCLKRECIECKAILPEWLKVCPYCGKDQIKKEVVEEVKVEEIIPEIIKTPEVDTKGEETLESK